MIMSLRNSVSAINTLQTRIDAIADNIAGINTTAFKKEKVTFADLMYRKMSESGRPVHATGQQPYSGTGIRPISIAKVYTQGNLTDTGRETDLAINGRGFLKIILPEGETAYTRDGSLSINSNGELLTTDGYSVYPEIILPEDYVEFSIQQNGKVSAKMADDTVKELGEITLYNFVNPDALIPLGRNLYSYHEDAGIEEEGIPGQNGFGLLEHKKLESSNVDISVEMTDLIESQRAYQLNAKALSLSDELWSMANNLRKY